MAEKTLTPEERKKLEQEAVIKAEREKAAQEKKEKEELEKALKKAKEELTEATLRNEIELEQEIKRRLEAANKKENVDIYIKLTATESFNWPGIFKIEKGESKEINQTKFDFLVNKVGNFVVALNAGKIRIG